MPALPTLTDAQRAALAARPASPVEVEDARTRARYLLVPVGRGSGAEEGTAEFDPADAYAALTATFAAGWSDPAMDAYDDYDAAPKP